ncbi:MAG: rod shape-determining protein [Proteobacteria bacterium]|jgi:rod shape-determining protein MreB|nr:rod shape-determining protein [Pseudomonadota bacterium]
MFSFFKDDGSAADLYVDLGTANTLIAARGKGLIVNEPTLIAYSETSAGKKRVVAVGLEAREKVLKTPGNINAIRPLKEGVIADFDTTETMLRYFLSRPEVKSVASRPRIVVSLPFGVTEVEKKAVIEAGKSAGAKSVTLIDEPMASAIGAGLPVKDPQGSMVVDIGGGTTEVAVIALADIVYCQACRVGGNKFDDAIVDYMKKKKGLIISETYAEQLKVQIGTATPKKDIRILEIQGRDVDSGLNRSSEITSEDVGNAMDESLKEIINAIHLALENTPPELVSDIIENGIILTGGGALIRDIDLRIQNEVRLPIRLAEDPLTTIARGGEAILSDVELLDKIKLEV